MAKNEAAIANMALLHLGHHGPFVTTLNPDDEHPADQTQEAEVCGIWFETARDSVLEDYPWPFAMTRAELNPIEDEPARDGWLYVYALPDGCVMPRKIIPLGSDPSCRGEDNPVPFEVEKSSLNDSQVILCNEASPVLFYTARITDPTRFSAKFTLATSYKLAELIAKSITGKVSDRDEMRRAYMIEVSVAEAVHMNARREQPEPETESIRARR